MIKTIGTAVERLNHYDTPQKVVFTVKSVGQKIWIGTSFYQLGATVNGVTQGQQIADTDNSIALDLQGEIYWIGSANFVQVEVLEAGAL